jgi:hypothetical protein
MVDARTETAVLAVYYTDKNRTPTELYNAHIND